MIYAIHKTTKKHRVIGPGDSWDFEWRIVQATTDGWIEWHGGECPLPFGDRFDAKLSGGGEIMNKGAARWEHAGGLWDIIAYRPIFDTKVSHPGTLAGPDKCRSDGGEPPAWDGSGDKPPVGSRCMKGRAEVLVIAHANVGSLYDPAVVYQPINHPMGIDWKVSNVFSPIRSEEDRAVEEMAIIIMDVPEDRDDKQDSTNIARALYRAGYRKEGK